MHDLEVYIESYGPCGYLSEGCTGLEGHPTRASNGGEFVGCKAPMGDIFIFQDLLKVWKASSSMFPIRTQFEAASRSWFKKLITSTNGV